MGRPRTPTQVLEDRGAFINHPERREERANEPVPNGELRKSPPSDLTPDERKIWFEFVRKVPAGVLADCDEYWLAIAVRLEWKERSRKISTTERTQYMNLLGKLGMNPSERSKVAARPVAKKEDEWSDLDNTQTM